MTQPKHWELPVSPVASEEALNLKGLTAQQRADYLAQRELAERAIAQGMEEVRLRQENLMMRGLMDEDGNLIDPPNLDDSPEAWAEWEAKRRAVISHRSEN